MGTRERIIKELSFSLPSPPQPRGAYVPAVRTGNLVFTAGQLPLVDGRLIAVGKVGAEVSLDQARTAAQQAAMNALAAVQGLVGTLDNIVKLVRLNVFVNSADGFLDQPKVADGASELLIKIFADAAAHTRCAIGAAELPMNAPVELDMIVEVKP